MKFLFDYLALVNHFVIAFLIWGSAIFMRRVWYVPASIGLWFFLVGVFFAVGIVQKDPLVIVNLEFYVGTPVLLIISIILMRAYWVLTTKKFRERNDD